MKPGEISPELLSENVVFHYFTPIVPELHGDYQGIKGVQEIFEKLARLSKGTFKVNPVFLLPAGDELVVTHTKNTMTLEMGSVETNVVLVWPIVDGKIEEVWDIPSITTAGVTVKENGHQSPASAPGA